LVVVFAGERSSASTYFLFPVYVFFDDGTNIIMIINIRLYLTKKQQPTTQICPI
jgi:hypothetical protein